MTKETQDYLAALLVAWHRDRAAGNNTAHIEAKIEGALMVAAAERLVGASSFVTVVACASGYTCEGPHGAVSQGATLPDALRNLAEACEISLPGDEVRK